MPGITIAEKAAGLCASCCTAARTPATSNMVLLRKRRSSSCFHADVCHGEGEGTRQRWGGCCTYPIEVVVTSFASRDLLSWLSSGGPDTEKVNRQWQSQVVRLDGGGEVLFDDMRHAVAQT
jgi:hypothetical protein